MSIEITERTETFPVNGTPDFKWNASSIFPYVTDFLRIEQPDEDKDKLIYVMTNQHNNQPLVKYGVAVLVGRQYTLQLRDDTIYIDFGFFNGPFDPLLNQILRGEFVRLTYNKVGTNYTLISEQRYS